MGLDKWGAGIEHMDIVKNNLEKLTNHELSRGSAKVKGIIVVVYY